MVLIPKLKVGSISKAITSPEIVAIISASVLAPVIQPFVTDFINKIPIARDHVTIALIIISIVVLLIAVKMKSGVFRAIIIGIAGSFLVIGAIPAVQQVLRR